MMTKEEVLNTIIEHYKNGSTSALSDYCDRVRCADCPFNTEDCVDDVAMAILDRLIKAEEKKETNFEHYVINAIDVTMEDDSEVWRFNFERGTQMQSFDRNSESVCDWLLEPYKSPKYKLSKFEYDLLECYHSGYAIKDFWQLEKMLDKGYFKGVPQDVQIEDILDNCEVIES